MKTVLSYFLIIVVASFSNAQEDTDKTLEVQSYNVGGRQILIQAPTEELVEVGHDYLVFLDSHVIKENRLVAAFYHPKDLQRILSGDRAFVMSYYGMVQVAASVEYIDCSDSLFKETTKYFLEQNGESLDSAVNRLEARLNHFLDSLGMSELEFIIDSPIQLGCLFSKQDAFGLGFLFPSSMGFETINLISSLTNIRVNKRLLILCLYAEYKDKGTLSWLRTVSEEWADTILALN